MSDVTRPDRAVALGLGISVILTTFVVWVVNALIYTARWDFIAFHPERAARQSPTISRAISDPRIGEPFADWMAICAPALFVGVTLLVLGILADLRSRIGHDTKTFGWFARMGGFLVILQAMASVGMVVLSHFRFPDHHFGHMMGSYLFFFSQALVVFGGQVISNAFSRLPEKDQVLLPVMVATRRKYIWVPVILAVVYLSCFVLKDVDLGAINKPLFVVYISTEPLLISSFLFYVLSFVPDCLAIVLRYVRGSSVTAA